MAETCKIKYSITISKGADVHIIQKICNRPAFQDGYCYCHFDDKSKDIKPIINELNSMSQMGRDLDFSLFVFPEVDFEFPFAIRKPIYFEKTKFYGKVSFAGHQFPSYTSFHSAEFYNDADFGYVKNIYENFVKFNDKVIFNNVVFHKMTKFVACEFSAKPEFIGTKFLGQTIFTWSKFKFNANPREKLFEFRQCEFIGDTDLLIYLEGDVPGFAFRYCELKGLKFSSLPDLNTYEYEFENNKWDKKKKLFSISRSIIRDEELLKNDPVKVRSIYKYLENYFFNNSDYNLAQHFYLGQMITLRKDKNYNKISRYVNHIYQIISNFGESIWRPSISLFLSLLAFPLVLLFFGTNINRVVDNKTNVTHVNYDLSSTQFELKEFISDYKACVFTNLSQSTIDRKNELTPYSDSIQKVVILIETFINIILASLIVIGVRRKFTFKKPL